MTFPKTQIPLLPNEALTLNGSELAVVRQGLEDKRVPVSRIADLVNLNNIGGVSDARLIATTAPLTGGGTLSSDLSLGISYATKIDSGAVRFSTDAEALAGINDNTAVTPAQVTFKIQNEVPLASTSAAGLLELATDAEAASTTSITYYGFSPRQISTKIANEVPNTSPGVNGLIRPAAMAEANSTTSTLTLGFSPKQISDKIANEVPLASTSAAGLLELATDAEALSTTSTIHYGFTPAQISTKIATEVPIASTTRAGIVRRATSAEAASTTNDSTLVLSPQDISQKIATEVPNTSTVTNGLIRSATTAEANSTTSTLALGFSPSQISTKINNEVPIASTTVQGKVELATGAEAQALIDPSKALTPQALGFVTATTTRRGLIETATDAEAGSTTSTTSFGFSPRQISTKIANEVPIASSAIRGLIEIATLAEVNTGTDPNRAVTPQTLTGAFGGSKSINGWMMLPNGWRLQWGRQNTEGVYNFPINFSSGVYFFLATWYGNHTTDDNSVSGKSLNNSQFQLYRSSGSLGEGIQWVALGV